MLDKSCEKLLNMSVNLICQHLLVAWFNCLPVAQSALETLAYFARIQMPQPDLLVCVLLLLQYTSPYIACRNLYHQSSSSTVDVWFSASLPMHLSLARCAVRVQARE